MLFIKACRYYGLMKSDQHVEGNQKDEATPGGDAKPDLHRNAKVIAGMAGLKNAGPPKSQGSYGGPRSTGSNAPKSAGSNNVRTSSNNPMSKMSGAPKSNATSGPAKPKPKMVDSGC